jgi:hypothetical protein
VFGFFLVAFFGLVGVFFVRDTFAQLFGAVSPQSPAVGCTLWRAALERAVVEQNLTEQAPLASLQSQCVSNFSVFFPVEVRRSSSGNTTSMVAGSAGVALSTVFELLTAVAAVGSLLSDGMAMFWFREWKLERKKRPKHKPKLRMPWDPPHPPPMSDVLCPCCTKEFYFGSDATTFSKKKPVVTSVLERAPLQPAPLHRNQSSLELEEGATPRFGAAMPVGDDGSPSQTEHWVGAAQRGLSAELRAEAGIASSIRKAVSGPAVSPSGRPPRPSRGPLSAEEADRVVTRAPSATAGQLSIAWPSPKAGSESPMSQAATPVGPVSHERLGAVSEEAIISVGIPSALAGDTFDDVEDNIGIMSVDDDDDDDGGGGAMGVRRGPPPADMD